MSERLTDLSGDLLALAETLLDGDASQAALRKATSAAYYALFQGMIYHACTRMFADEHLRVVAARCFEHGAMREVCNAYAEKDLRKHRKLGSIAKDPVSRELTSIAKAFPHLQAKRHAADYDFSVSLDMDNARTDVLIARNALRALVAASADPSQAEAFGAFCGALLLSKQYRA